MKTEELYQIYLQNPNITTDSRKCPEHSIFFGIKGEHFDGTLYGDKAIENGAAFAVTEDSLAVMQRLANHHVKQLKKRGLKVIGITGTNGKTTTKELVAAVLQKKYNILYTQGNFNNHLGVPLTLLRLRPEHEIAIVEMGANHPGEIRDLANIAEPEYGLISTVGRAHLEGFGSFEGVIRTKGELYDYIRANGGKIFLNAENQHLLPIAAGIPATEYFPSKAATEGRKEFFVKFQWKGQTVNTKLIGDYNITNLVAAATVGEYFGVPDQDIIDALQEYQPTNNRSQLTKTDRNTLIVDAYNANPTSMAAALDNFCEIEADGKMVILGSMGELGEVSQTEHINIIKRLESAKLQKIWLVGQEFARALETIKTTLPQPFLQTLKLFSDVNHLIATIQESPLTSQTILIKGSNSQKLFLLPPEL